MAYAFAIEPNTYNAFENEEAQIDQCKEWGLLSEKAVKTKAFFYKGNGMNIACSIIGLVDHITAVIQFDNKQLHCIHPSFLKEMQAANYGQKLAAAADEAADQESEPAEPETAKEEAPPAAAAEAKPEKPQTDKPAKEKTKKEKTQKLQLPEEKVKMSAIVKEFTTVPNHFSDTDDEVVIYEAVCIEEPAVEVGAAWSSHSATLKKQELEVGDKITFEGKIVAKKLTKNPVPYKINNPAKIQKQN